ncbi:MAG: tyrosine-type recombinase/integrase [Candidatus Aerophobus sp.]|nr:MAG: tyrosine-type recombinase/integrase [Candidatus Aerophobus sp.]
MHKESRQKAVAEGSEISVFVEACIKAEVDRNLSPLSLKELRRYLKELVEHCKGSGFSSISQLTPEFLKDFVEQYWERGNCCLVKAMVWALRKFGGYLALVQALPNNPAQYLHHPKISKRAKLPEYLTQRQLRQLLKTAASKHPFLDFVILSLFATTGLRSGELVSLKRDRVYLKEHRILIWVKGGWFKNTPLSTWMCAILESYLATREDDLPALFINDKGHPVTMSFIQHMIKDAGKDAGIPFPVTARHLRHTFATHAADRHGRLITSALLGHAHSRTTQVYMHLSPRRFQSLMNKHPYKMRGALQ